MGVVSPHLQVEHNQELSRIGRFVIYEHGLIMCNVMLYCVGTIESILQPQQRITP